MFKIFDKFKKIEIKMYDRRMKIVLWSCKILKTSTCIKTLIRIYI